MLILTTCPAALVRGGQVAADLVQALIQISAAGNIVYVISNQQKPAWFDQAFNGSNVAYRETDARQRGVIIGTIAAHHKVSPHDILVLAVKSEDVQMAKNGRAVLIAAGWSTDQQVKGLGIRVNNAQELQELIQLTNGWQGHWWFHGAQPRYTVHALVDLSSYGKGVTQQLFANKLTQTVKNGGGRLTALLTVLSRSFLIDDVDKAEDLLWGVYPSSGNTNGADEVLTDFTHRLRTTTSRVRYAKVGEPLFVRHAASIKRSGNKSIDRNDPTDQVLTLHLNPYYKGKIRGRNVIVIDDCTTYGVSFGVAAAFLLAAGAKSVHGVAVGKFGNALSFYDIAIQSDPFAPVVAGGFTVNSSSAFPGKTDSTAQAVLQVLIP